MPARIVVAHDDRELRESVVTALQTVGYEVKAFAGSMEAPDTLIG
jgi:FixJ family two-component response regulator